MTSSPGRRRRAWKIAIAAIAAPFVVVAAFWGWMRVIEIRKWAAMERRCAELQAREYPANPNRLPLQGPPDPGDAWEDYGAALAPFSDGKPETSAIWQVLDHYWSTKQETLEKEATTLLAVYRSPVHALRRGARRATAGRPLPEVHRSAIAIVSSLVRNTAGAIGRDRPEEAINLLVSLLQFGIDLDAAGNDAATMPLDSALEGLGRLFRTTPLHGLPDLERVLLRTEQSLSARRLTDYWVQDFGSKIITHPEDMRDEGYFGSSWDNFKADWRYGFSVRHLTADMFLWLDRWAGQRVEGEGLPYAIAETRLLEQKQEIDSCRNRYAVTLGTYLLPHPNYRNITARLRILRTACGARDLKDPYGDLIRTWSDGEMLRIWSIGPDAVDAGGVGVWDDRDARDIVLEIHR